MTTAVEVVVVVAVDVLLSERAGLTLGFFHLTFDFGLISFMPMNPTSVVIVE